jgi:hypothetical protein
LGGAHEEEVVELGRSFEWWEHAIGVHAAVQLRGFLTVRVDEGGGVPG